MSSHIENRHMINNLLKTEDIANAIEQINLSEADKEILRLKYIKKCDLRYICDTLGIAYSTAGERHIKALAKLCELIKTSKQS